MRTSTLATLEANFAEHPWRTLGTAFLLGAWLGLDPPRVPRNRFARAIFATIGAVTLRVGREVVLAELIGRARAMHATSA